MPRKALLLGRNGHEGDESSLRWCCNYDPDSHDPDKLSECDVRKMRDVLRSRGYDPVDVIPEACQDEGAVLTALKRTLHACAQEDRFLFYFSGHASYEEDGLHLVLNAQGRYPETFPATKLIELLQNECDAGTKLVILDCCYAESAKKTWVPSRYDNLRFLVSTKSLVHAKEVYELNGGIFTYCLCEALTDRAYWRSDAPQPLADSDGRIYSNKLLGWLKWRIPIVGHGQQPDIELPEPTADADQDEPFLIAQVTPPEIVGWPADLLARLDSTLAELSVSDAAAAASYAYCRGRADSGILPHLGEPPSLHLMLKLLYDPDRYYLKSNRLKLPLLTFVAHLARHSGDPDSLTRWIADAGKHIHAGANVPESHISQATDLSESPDQGQLQPYLMIQVAPVQNPPGSYRLSWDYIDEYGRIAEDDDTVQPVTRSSQDDLIHDILAAARSLPSKRPCKPQIEIILPLSLLQDDGFVDRLERILFRGRERSPANRLVLGGLAAEFSLVLRCWERWFEELLVNDLGGTDARAYWRANAHCLPEAPKVPCLRWLKSGQETALRAAASRHLNAVNPARRALAFGSAEPISPEDLEDLLLSGAPILLWPRHGEATPSVLKNLKRCITSCAQGASIDKLPHALHQHRRHAASTQSGAPCAFSLLWEDPDRPIFALSDYDTSAMDRS